ncbi:TPA: hypothetical protein JAW46_002883 [Enterococcus faecium]|uniref:Uncharacterized protein n=1 Tax=Enterococcus faecium TaxID=1352 RepID=A0A8F5V5L7_ENTFC|nr:hypothetical protein Tn6711_000066 [Enterococcus faecium]HAT7602506.1 hypothetical protein [Enterococcus faecium]HAT7605172.1 hypothetical protein [Enterococcus faecium]
MKSDYVFNRKYGPGVLSSSLRRNDSTINLKFTKNRTIEGYIGKESRICPDTIYTTKADGRSPLLKSGELKGRRCSILIEGIKILLTLLSVVEHKSYN